LSRIPFNRPYATGKEFVYIQQAIDNLHLSGNGPFTERCAGWLEDRTGSPRALMTGSCTAALELAALVAGLGAKDEVIVPSFTFVSTANAIVLRGAVPVFVDIRPDTLTIDEAAIEPALTEQTRAILPVHYAGVSCEMDTILAIAEQRGLAVIEDAAQAMMSTYHGRPLGSLGQLGCLSFHETKNVSCGEGGALLVNEPDLVERAEVMQEKGTNRHRFFRGEADLYTWLDRGSSFPPSDISAAFLWAQLEHAESITRRRMEIWSAYHERLAELEARGLLRRPIVPTDREHNAHMYYVLVEDRQTRDRLIAGLDEQGIVAVFHYVPLHSSPAGRRFGRTPHELPVTDATSDRLVRLPLWVGMGEAEVEAVTTAVADCL
jgi:dTDP-4-amino-4,6-dideoxygalactose transaminase